MNIFFVFFTGLPSIIFPFFHCNHLLLSGNPIPLKASSFRSNNNRFFSAPFRVKRGQTIQYQTNNMKTQNDNIVTEPSVQDLAKVENTLSDSLKSLVNEAKILYEEKLYEKSKNSSINNQDNKVYITVAPGRVNLIGEHTDYTGGFVLPLAIDYSTVVYGAGSIIVPDNDSSEATCASVRFASTKSPDKVEEFEINIDISQPPENTKWTNYVIGTVYQYLKDLPQGTKAQLSFTISGNVPLGSGLSSSASLEVAVARFVESIWGGRHSFSSEAQPVVPAKTRALRCQKAENEWCNSPCGIMDQYVSSAGKDGTLLLIDCTSLEYQETKMAQVSSPPVLVVTNSNVQHDIAGGEYPVRVAQCKAATAALAKVNANIKTLRDATMDDVNKAKELMDDISFKRSKHVVTENDRTVQAKKALENGDWKKVGELMNASHASMRDDYEVSCDEIDILVDIAQNYPGVYGSRLTGGGFGGCTVTLVEKDNAEGLMKHLIDQYKSKTKKDCVCFTTGPAAGARLLATDSL